MDLAVVLGSKDIAVQLHVAGHTGIVDIESKRLRDLDRLLGVLIFAEI
jgi:hypothetical protein